MLLSTVKEILFLLDNKIYVISYIARPLILLDFSKIFAVPIYYWSLKKLVTDASMVIFN